MIGCFIMRTLRSVVENPSGLDSFANYAGDVPDDNWDCLLTQTRDSGTLERSNFAAALHMVGGESDDVQILRYGHWACGWWEALAIKQGTLSHIVATDISNRLADYPIVDEDHLGNIEQEEADHIWRTCYDAEDRIAYIRNHRSQFEFSDWRYLRACVRGEYFAGYASELCQS